MPDLKSLCPQLPLCSFLMQRHCLRALEKLTLANVARFCSAPPHPTPAKRLNVSYWGRSSLTLFTYLEGEGAHISGQSA